MTDLPTKQEVNNAFRDARKLTKVEKERPKKKTPGGQKRTSMTNNSTRRVPLNGCDKETSEKIRTIVACRFGGKTLEESARQAGTTLTAANNLRIRNQDAFNQAEQEHLEAAIRQHQSNLWIINTCLSDMGPRAIRTIDKVMRSKASKPETKLKAAQMILEMLDASKRKGSDDGHEAGIVADNLVYIKNTIKKIEDSYVVEAEGVEVVD